MAVALGWVVGACARLPPEQVAREQAMWDAARLCQARVGTVSSIDQIDVDGRLRYSCLGSCPDRQAFESCYAERLAEAFRSGAISSSGHVAPESRNIRRAEISVTFEGNAVFVPVSLNGTHAATLLLDTGATISLLRPPLAQQLGVAPARGGPATMRLEVVGGQKITVPVGRLRSIGAGGLLVEDLDVGIYDALPSRQDVQGLLGGDFLRNFRVTIDRGARRLILEVP